MDKLIKELKFFEGFEGYCHDDGIVNQILRKIVTLNEVNVAEVVRRKTQKMFQ